MFYSSMTEYVCLPTIGLKTEATLKLYILPVARQKLALKSFLVNNGMYIYNY